MGDKKGRVLLIQIDWVVPSVVKLKMWAPQKFLNLDVLCISLVFGNLSCDSFNSMSQMQHSAMGFPGSTSVKDLTCQCRRCKRLGFDPWIRKIPWSRKWHPTPIFLPEEFMGRRAWWPTVHEVAKSQTRLSTWAYTVAFCCRSYMVGQHSSN